MGHGPDVGSVVVLGRLRSLDMDPATNREGLPLGAYEKARKPVWSVQSILAAQEAPRFDRPKREGLEVGGISAERERPARSIKA